MGKRIDAGCECTEVHAYRVVRSNKTIPVVLFWPLIYQSLSFFPFYGINCILAIKKDLHKRGLSQSSAVHLRARLL